MTAAAMERAKVLIDRVERNVRARYPDGGADMWSALCGGIGSLLVDAIADKIEAEAPACSADHVRFSFAHGRREYLIDYEFNASDDCAAGWTEVAHVWHRDLDISGPDVLEGVPAWAESAAEQHEQRTRAGRSKLARAERALQRQMDRLVQEGA